MVVADDVAVTLAVRFAVAVCDECAVSESVLVVNVARPHLREHRIVVASDEHRVGPGGDALVCERFEGRDVPFRDPVESVEHVARKDDFAGSELRTERRESLGESGLLTQREVHGGRVCAADVQVREDDCVRVGEVDGTVTDGGAKHVREVGRRRQIISGRRHRIGGGGAGAFLFDAPLTRSMSGALEDKRTATRFRILAEIADRQPAVSQGEIAEAVGVTSQAVSEYIRELVDDELVEKEGRSRYRVTKEGVDWLFQEARDLQRFAEHVTDDVLESVNEDAAIVTDDVAAGETVTLSLRDGLLYATPGDDGPAIGVSTTDAEEGEDASVTGFEGVIEMEPGSVRVLQIPPARLGGSSDVDLSALADACTDADIVVASGVEAVVACRRAAVSLETWFSPGEVAADAAARGLDAVVVASTDAAGRVTDALRDAGVLFEVTEP